MHSTSEKDSDSKILRAVLKIAPSPPLDTGCWMPGVFGVFGVFWFLHSQMNAANMNSLGLFGGEAAKISH
jgi:hypothetical protein